MATSGKIKELLNIFDQFHIDGYIIPSNDKFQSEFVPDCYQRLKYLTNFSGSAGTALILKNQKILFTDGRYIAQAKKELSVDFEVINTNDISIKEWLISFCKKTEINLKIGIDGELITEYLYQNLQSKFYDLVILPKNLVDKIWNDKPEIPQSKIFIYDIKYAGKHALDKIHELNLDENVELICDPSLICWLLNIRAGDVEYNPVLLSYFLLKPDNSGVLFTDNKNITQDIIEYLHDINIQIKSFDSLENELKKITHYNVNIKYNDKLTPVNLSHKIKSLHQNNIIIDKSTAVINRAVKNKIEIENIIDGHIKDGVAVTQFIYWLKNYKNIEELSELSIVDKILEFRKKQSNFLYPSFATIAGFADNGAIIHYHPDEKSNKKFTNNNLLLIDSGGQYLGATTDITRVISFGTPSPEQIKNYTLVLKGHIALASQIFPENTSGIQLDIIARQYLWDQGLDYDHGTGHGVGAFLGVHEGPQAISRGGSTQALLENMILSNEPGYYKVGEYGIRIENLVRVVKKGKINGKIFLGFETITLVPFEYNLIDYTMLNHQEKYWLKQYENAIKEKIFPHLNDDEIKWYKKIMQ